MIGEEQEGENQAMITVREEDPTLASVMRRFAERGWKALHDGVLWWTLDDDATIISLNNYNETAIELTVIVTPDPEKRKRGSGGKTLRTFLGLLDELGIGCYLRAVPPKEWGPLCRFRPPTEHGLGKKDLRAWYRRHGFTPVPMGHGLAPVVGHPLANVEDVMYRAASSASDYQPSRLVVSRDGRCSDRRHDNV
jgi:hypothetical protein